MQRLSLLATLFISIFFSLVSYSASSTTLTQAEVRSLAKEAYIFSYPLIMNYRTMYLQAIDAHSNSYTGGFGKLRSNPNPSTPQDKDVVTPNIDTPYTWGWVDLRAEPWVLTLPAVDKNRYYTSQWDDLWGYILDSPGSVKDGEQGGNYLLVDSTWQGEVPPGIKRVIIGESKFLGGITRTEFFGEEDLEKVRKIQQSYQLQPLSTFLKKEAPAPHPEIDWPVWEEGIEKTEKVFKYVNFILPYTNPNKADKMVLNRIAKIGIKSGVPWQPENFDSETQDAIKEGVNDAIQSLQAKFNTAKSATKLFGTRKTMPTDYLNRAAGVYGGMFGNLADQAFYIPLNKDWHGYKLNGDLHDYVLQFPANKTPPVKYFWSLTLYSLPDRLLAENALKRYSISSRSKLNKSADGSITIYIQKNTPGKDKESNWLPIPAGPFYLVLRAYGPDKDIIDGKWKLPEVIIPE